MSRTGLNRRLLFEIAHIVINYRQLAPAKSPNLREIKKKMEQSTSPNDGGNAAIGLIERLRIRLLGLSRDKKQVTMVFADAVGIFACVYAAGWLLFGDEAAVLPLGVLAAVALIFTIPLSWSLGHYRSIIRYMGLDLFVAGFRTALMSAFVVGSVGLMTGLVAAPVRWAAVYGALLLIFVIGSRMVARMFLNRRNLYREQVIIYGAGEGGARLAAALLSGDDYLPVAIVDDNVALKGKRVQGLEVFLPSRLKELVESNEVTGVLLAIPSASRHRRRQILEQLSQYPVHVRTIPEIRDLVSGKSRVDDLSDVDVKDILGRDEVPPNQELLRASVTGKSVLVTGAGGSIGSELCRQIMELNPRRLVCVDISEHSLYQIDQELKGVIKRQKIDCDLIALLGSAHHEKRMLQAMQAFGTQTVYHAAAYKHVPIVEHNLFEGIHNNVFGTLHTARAAINANVETFVLISTDKAVNPTNVMGATKRLSEQVLQAYNSRAKNTRFCMVRFGNVLESSGSVVPLFREQIRSGGPVTVTHRDIIRYFMTIPEAAQLVIQAASMAKGGDVFVLDMGKPVRIQDLARRMINLMGLTVRSDDNPDGDIEIQYIGLRPAEKLFEELLIGSRVTGTEHPRIMRADEDSLSFEELDELITDLKTASAEFDYSQARDILMRAVAEYSPTNGIDDLVWLRKTGTDGAVKPSKVVDFPGRDI